MPPLSTHPWRSRLALVPAAVLLAACGTLPDPAPPVLKAATGARLQQCTALATQFRHERTRLDSAADVAGGALQLGDTAVGAHCLVKGRMNIRQGADGREYAIGFEMRLPQDWNGRFFYQGNGGLDGTVHPAQGALGGGPQTGALVQGFAVISSDAGHTGAQTPFFGSEPQARLDYGYQAVERLTPMAKALIAAAYGKGPDRSYIGGCSNGGRHALVAASRLGDSYDGYLVGAPGYRLPLAALAQLWGAQQWAPLATPGATIRHPMNPNATLTDLGSAFTPPERQRLARAVLEQCDALDGLQDGLVQDIQACQARFDVSLHVPTCTAGRDGSCLTAAQKQVLAKVFAGARTATGEPFYAPFPWDSGVSAANWATWKFVNALALDPLAVGSVFSVPQGRVDPLTEDITVRLPLFSATSATFRESGLSLMTPPGHGNPVNLAPLQARGAKIVLYHGVSDAIFSADDTRQWLERLDRAQAGKAAEFARYFPVPGMAHCTGGPATDRFDLLTPLVNWVEHGQAPQAVLASARGTGPAATRNPELPADWSPSRTRPLCAWPTVARYRGQGDPESAASFECR